MNKDWKDTVMSIEKLKELDEKWSLSNFIDVLQEVAKAQAEISYKAGKQSILDFIRHHTLIKPDKNSITRYEPFYQITEKELKELG
jgi:hypothetical protein